MTLPEQSACVLTIASVNQQGYVMEETRERYIAGSIGEALEAHAPDPAPGARWDVRYEGRGRRL